MSSLGAGEDTWRIAAATRDRLGESPMWDVAGQALYWIDWYNPIVHRLVPATGKLSHWTVPGATTIGSIVLVSGGRLLLALETGLHIFDPDSGSLAQFADPNAQRQGVGYNDAKIDRAGRCWIGTYDHAEIDPRGILYNLDANGRSAIGDSGFAVCNGPAFSPDGATLYFSDTVGRRILAYDMSPTSPRLTNRRLFAVLDDTEGMPDGLTVDASGDVWCAHYGAGRISRYASDGTRKSLLQLPCPVVTSLCFGGRDLRTLYVTTGWSPGITRGEDETGPGGNLLSIGADTAGLAEPVFQLPS